MAELLLNNKGSMEEALRLEADVWALLDTLVALATRVRGSRPALPYGLLQLRPQVLVLLLPLLLLGPLKLRLLLAA